MNGVFPVGGGQLQAPEILVRAGANAVFAGEEFFKATVNNAHRKRACGRSVARAADCASVPGRSNMK